LASWLADISVTLRSAVITLGLFCNASLANSSQAFIAVNISCTLIGHKFTRVSVGVTEVSNLAIIVRFTATSVVRMADRLGVGTVESILMTAWTAAK